MSYFDITTCIHTHTHTHFIHRHVPLNTLDKDRANVDQDYIKTTWKIFLVEIKVLMNSIIINNKSSDTQIITKKALNIYFFI